MSKEEYVKTLYIDGIKVDVGLDDYGQCYFFEYTDENGNLIEVGCGTYNFNYEDEIFAYFGK